MDKLYTIIPNNCTGCRTCKVACAAAKGKNGALGRSRIQISDMGNNRFVQLNCLQCANAACKTVCPTDALRRNETSGAIEHVKALCIRCGLCAAACPFGHIYFDEKDAMPLKCDLCGGDPTCVKFCPHKALEMR
jgi:carbon-monoxide dehydrogenase iron sulfur subunit